MEIPVPIPSLSKGKRTRPTPQRDKAMGPVPDGEEETNQGMYASTTRTNQQASKERHACDSRRGDGKKRKEEKRVGIESGPSMPPPSIGIPIFERQGGSTSVSPLLSCRSSFLCGRESRPAATGHAFDAKQIEREGEWNFSFCFMHHKQVELKGPRFKTVGQVSMLFQNIHSAMQQKLNPKQRILHPRRNRTRVILDRTLRSFALARA